MSGVSDDQLAQFRAQSDRAFFEMQKEADRAHAEFVKKYGGELNYSPPVPTASASYPVGPGPGTVSSRPTPPPPARPATPKPAAKPVARPAVNPAEKLYEAAPAMDLGGLSKESFEDSVNDVREDLGKLSANLREESRAAARDAMKGTSDILRGKASGLGQKAKEEAARLKQAMQKAMEEERSLKSMKGRAQDELKKAKERFKSHVEEAKDDTLNELRSMASDGADALKGKAMDAFEEGQASVEREWKDFTSGQDS